MKKIFTLCLWAGLTGLLFTACSDDDDNYTPKAPEVSILNAENVNICKPGETILLKAQTNETIGTSLQWSVNGQNMGQDSVYSFTSTETGMFNVTLTASNESGIDSDSISLMVSNIISLDDITNWTGNGDNRAALAIQWLTADCENILAPADDEIFSRVWGYRWNTGEKPTGEEMLRAIAKNDPHLYVIFMTSQYGTSPMGFVYDTDGDGFELSDGTNSFTEADFTDGLYEYEDNDYYFDNMQVSEGDYWIGGMMTAFTCYWNLDNAESLQADFAESQLAMNQRILANNSWDAWTLSMYDPANPVNPAPVLHLLKAAE